MKTALRRATLGLVLFTGACANARPVPDFNGQRRHDRLRRTAETSIVWSIRNDNWNAFRVTAVVDGTTRLPLGTIEGHASTKKLERSMWAVGRTVQFELLNAVTGERHVTDAYLIAPGQRVVMHIQHSVRLTTVFPRALSASEVAEIAKRDR
jgi:hypothetical protein